MTSITLSLADITLEAPGGPISVPLSWDTDGNGDEISEGYWDWRPAFLAHLRGVIGLDNEESPEDLVTISSVRLNIDVSCSAAGDGTLNLLNFGVLIASQASASGFAKIDDEIELVVLDDGQWAGSDIAVRGFTGIEAIGNLTMTVFEITVDYELLVSEFWTDFIGTEELT